MWRTPSRPGGAQAGPLQAKQTEHAHLNALALRGVGSGMGIAERRVRCPKGAILFRAATVLGTERDHLVVLHTWEGVPVMLVRVCRRVDAEGLELEPYAAVLRDDERI